MPVKYIEGRKSPWKVSWSVNGKTGTKWFAEKDEAKARRFEATMHQKKIDGELGQDNMITCREVFDEFLLDCQHRNETDPDVLLWRYARRVA